MRIGKRKTLIELSEEKEFLRNQKGKNIFKDGVNQRADIKQNEVVQSIEKVVPCAIKTESIDLGRKKITFESLANISELSLTYFTKNNLYTRIFELLVGMSFPSESDISCNLSLKIHYTGNIKISNVFFEGTYHNPLEQKLAEQLNQVSLIKDRVLCLQALDLMVKYDTSSQKWDLGVATGKGSVVWTLFPPVLQLTPLDCTDAIKLIELFQLLVAEIKSFEQAITGTGF